MATLSQPQIKILAQPGKDDLYDVTEAGLAIEITIPANVKLEQAVLSLEAPPDSFTRDVYEDTHITTDKPDANLKTLDQVRWMTLDLRARRAITGIKVGLEPVGSMDGAPNPYKFQSAAGQKVLSWFTSSALTLVPDDTARLVSLLAIPEARERLMSAFPELKVVADLMAKMDGSVLPFEAVAPLTTFMSKGSRTQLQEILKRLSALGRVAKKLSAATLLKMPEPLAATTTTATATTSTTSTASTASTTTTASTTSTSPLAVSIQPFTRQDPDRCVLVKLAEPDGPWFPLYPNDSITVRDGVLCFPSISAGRVMLEFGYKVKQYEARQSPTTATDGSDKGETSVEYVMTGENFESKLDYKVSDLQIFVAARPSDLSVGITGQSPFFRHAGLLPGQQKIELREDLTEALQKAWPKDLAGGKLVLTVSAAGRGKVLAPQLDVYTKLVAQPSATEGVTPSAASTGSTQPLQEDATLTAGQELVIDVPLDAPAGQRIGPLQGRLHTKLSPERSLNVPAVPSDTKNESGTNQPSDANATVSARIGHYCDLRYVAAQGFAPLPSDSTLTAIELWASPITRVVQGTVAIHAEKNGEPDTLPIGSAIPFSWSQESSPPWPAQWLRAELPPKLAVPGRFYVVLTVTAGELSWWLGTGTAAAWPSLLPAGARYRIDGGAWLSRKLSSKPDPFVFAYCRPRVLQAGASQDAPLVSVPDVRLTWASGGASVRVPIGADGSFELDEADLALLGTAPAGTGGQATPLRFLVNSPHDGSVGISDLQVEFGVGRPPARIA